MKKRLFTLLAASLFVTSYASAQLSIGAQAGANLASMRFYDDDNSYDDDLSMQIGFNAGLAINYELSDALSFRTGLLYSAKGAKQEYSDETSFSFAGTTTTIVSTGNSKISLGYVEVPLALRLNLEMGDAILFVEGGPFLGFGIAGKSTYESETTTTTDDGTTQSSSTSSSSGSDNIEWGSDEMEDDLKPFDFGIYPSAGLRMGNVEFGVSYKMGLANISPYTDNGYTIKNNVIGIDFRFWFGD